MHIAELKREVDAVKAQVEDLKAKGVAEVLAATLQTMQDEIMDIEKRFSELEKRVPVSGAAISGEVSEDYERAGAGL